MTQRERRHYNRDGTPVSLVRAKAPVSLVGAKAAMEVTASKRCHKKLAFHLYD